MIIPLETGRQRFVAKFRTRSERLKQAVRHLRKADPVMRRVIDHVGPCTLKCERDRFWMLVRSILSQQISTAAARTVRNRVVALVESTSGSKRVTSESLLTLSVDELRSAGCSQRKAEYMLDLAGQVASGELELAKIGRSPNEAVINSLVQVRGIGRWTAEMFLMFSLGRLDVFPVDDLGVRNAMLDLYGLDRSASHGDFRAIAELWQPYASIGSWYCWRSLETDIPSE
jgi:DNA-3-methyladenine glycosylase II